MLTFQDCLALCELTEDEVDAIAEHEHVPEMVALELGSYLARSEEGERRIEEMIIDDIAASKHRGDLAHVAKLKKVLHHFVTEHPHASGLRQ